MTKILINISKTYRINSYIDFAYNDLYEKYGIKTYIYFSKKVSEKILKRLEVSNYYEIFFYESKNDLVNQIKSINKKDIYYINTFEELLIPLVCDIKIILGFEVSNTYFAFRNKLLQREILLKNFPETTISYFKINVEKDNIEKYYDKINFPYIIKPSSGVQSSGVSIINNKNDLVDYIKNIKDLSKNMSLRGLENNLFLIEEFIDGDMYTINYFVDIKGNIFYSPIIKVNSSQSLGINDFSNYVRINGKIINEELDFDKVITFVEKNVSAFGLKNTFVHHEFKNTSKNILKTIEINGRIGGYRLEMIQESYNFNLLSMPLGKSFSYNFSCDTNLNNAVFVFYPNKKGIFKGFNIDLLEKIKKLDSYNYIKLLKQYIGKEVGLTKDGFSSLASLRIINNDLEKFKSDYDFIEENYINLIILE